jgi:DNA repair exonuclease SbcCD ATPase subunit
MTEAANHIAAQAAEIESLRAQCGLRQIQGYKEGRAKAEDEIARLQSSLDRLTGMKFSDRIHAALVSRAEKAEAEIARLRISEAAIRESWQTLNAENARLIKELIDGKDEIARFKADLRQETEIVDRIWAIFGTPTYEELKGRSIYDLVSQAKADAESNRRAHARYEHVRRLNVRQFADLFERNLHGEGAFDDLVDAALGNAEGESREH